MEKEVLGFYLTAHPLDEHRQTLGTYCSHTTAEVGKLKDRTEVMMGGMISSIKFAHVRKVREGATATKYANFDLEDVAGAIRCILWPDDFVNFGELVQPDAILVARGAIDRRGGGDEANLVVNELIPLDQLDARYTRGIMVRVDQQQHGPERLKQLHEILRGYPGNCELQLVLRMGDGTHVFLRSGQMRVEMNPEMRRRVDELLGAGNFRLLTATPNSGSSRRNGNGRYARRT